MPLSRVELTEFAAPAKEFRGLLIDMFEKFDPGIGAFGCTMFIIMETLPCVLWLMYV